MGVYAGATSFSAPPAFMMPSALLASPNIIYNTSDVAFSHGDVQYKQFHENENIEEESSINDLSDDEMQRLVEESWNIQTDDSIVGNQAQIDRLWNNILNNDTKHRVIQNYEEVWEASLLPENNVYSFSSTVPIVDQSSSSSSSSIDTSLYFQRGMERFAEGNINEAVQSFEIVIQAGLKQNNLR